ncbi:hypothetical protein CCHR01_14661 [Colletotrichum chrysophilum]|uniref:Uncharacterized protein n=1 Tax=Colletotrichum chrysophilum TaxID=1836956 RepID=A0AAD9A7Q3_9PEZI|nr:hypothetical protein CCHR01_14661 [Colletotrichum chrysophilum]
MDGCKKSPWCLGRGAREVTVTVVGVWWCGRGMELGESIRPRTLFRTLHWPLVPLMVPLGWGRATVIGQAFQSCTISWHPWLLGLSPWVFGSFWLLGRSHAVGWPG